MIHRVIIQDVKFVKKDITYILTILVLKELIFLKNAWIISLMMINVKHVYLQLS